MIAFDTDLYSDLSKGVPAVVNRAGLIPPASRFVPVVVAEEVLRGQLAAIRSAQGGGQPPLPVAYAYLEQSLRGLRSVQVLPYTPAADGLFVGWRAAGIRIGTRDLRIAAICLTAGVKLATRNARDFGLVPGLSLDVWP